MLEVVSVPTQTTKIHHQEMNTEVFVDEQNLGKGSLFITEDNVIWQNEHGAGFTLAYPDIQLHAISRDKNAFSKDCLFLMVEPSGLPFGAPMQEDMNGSTNDDDDEEGTNGVEDDESNPRQVRMCPENVLDLEPMFEAMNRCQELHPDPTMNDSDDEEYDCNDEEFGGGDMVLSREMTDGDNEHLPSSFFTADGQFSDAVLQQLQMGQVVQIDSQQLNRNNQNSNGERQENDGDEQMEMEDHEEN